MTFSEKTLDENKIYKEFLYMKFYLLNQFITIKTMYKYYSVFLNKLHKKNTTLAKESNKCNLNNNVYNCE